MIEQNYILNLVPNKVPLIVNCSQYDSLSRTINMKLYDGTEVYEIPSGTTATVRGTKQDNTGFEYPCEIEGSTVSFDIQDQMTIFSGRVPSEIRLTNNGEIIGTCNFEFYVEPTPLDPNVTISETDLPLLEEAEQNAIRAEQAASQATTVLASSVKSVNNTLPDANGNVNVSGISIPGGTQGQVLTKLSSAEGDFDWENVDGLPSGGTTGQVLTKQSNVDGDADWEDASAELSAGNGISIANDTVTNTAPIWHGDEVGDSPVPLNADQLQGHPSSYFQSALTTATATATLSANSDHVAISAPTVSGYEFMLWVSARAVGWVDGVYIENPTGANTSVWRNNGMSSPAIASGGTVTALAIYKKS